MSDEKYNRSLIIDTNALLYQLAYWIEIRIDSKTRRLKDSRINKAHDLISKYSKKYITQTIKSEFFEDHEVKHKFMEEIRKLLGIRSRIISKKILEKPLSKLKERITEIQLNCLQSELDAIEAFYDNIISTLTDDDKKLWNTGYGEGKPLMPEPNDRKILAECIKMEEDVCLISNDRAFTFDKFKTRIESDYDILIECL